MRKITAIILVVILFFTCAKEIKAVKQSELHARAAILVDAENMRVLYGKNEHERMAVASTTKIMTLLVALEYGDMEGEVCFSSYAASQPDVQLNAGKGERYRLEDLLYIMMLKSYNDVAVAVAEHVGGILNGDASPNETREESIKDVARFVDMMNEKARNLGCLDTYFITPNGLDATDDKGYHSSSAYDLALIGAYAIRLEKVTQICTTRSYSYMEINRKRTGTVYNADRFLDMVPGAVGLKTGFTGEAGYCFVGAIKQEGRSFVSVVLGSGWPPNKNYKWSDTKTLMNYGMDNYFPQTLHEYESEYKKLAVRNGTRDTVMTYIPFEVECIVSDSDVVNVVYECEEVIKAPVQPNEEVGRVCIYINDRLMYRLPILTVEGCGEKDMKWYLRYFVMNLTNWT